MKTTFTGVEELKKHVQEQEKKSNAMIDELKVILSNSTPEEKAKILTILYSTND